MAYVKWVLTDWCNFVLFDIFEKVTHLIEQKNRHKINIKTKVINPEYPTVTPFSKFDHFWWYSFTVMAYEKFYFQT